MNADDTLKAIHQLRQLCEQSVGTGVFSESAYDEIRSVCDELRASNLFDIWASSLVSVIEDYDDKVDLTAGYPGDFGHALESGSLEKSCKLYIESLNRKPTGLITGLADRAYRSEPSNCGFDIELFNSVLSHPKSSVSAQEIANMVVNPW